MKLDAAAGRETPPPVSGFVIDSVAMVNNFLVHCMNIDMCPGSRRSTNQGPDPLC